MEEKRKYMFHAISHRLRPKEWSSSQEEGYERNLPFSRPLSPILSRRLRACLARSVAAPPKSSDSFVEKKSIDPKSDSALSFSVSQRLAAKGPNACMHRLPISHVLKSTCFGNFVHKQQLVKVQTLFAR